ncbi:hypothetical protein LG634_34685 [Streptomyces bambusae]|uniref:hypothetical protein n=1 Tax=Streptomyces bambusae TaxID=1550616 RepID=UPI001CFF70A7|nr:hypothetical protein [Streptomyces bambusae]MCB5169936.1 hypothetical protein [Streptomyces bambusae]
MRHRQAPATFRSRLRRMNPRLPTPVNGTFSRCFLILGAKAVREEPRYVPSAPRRPARWGAKQKRNWPTTVASPVTELRRVEATAAALVSADQVELILRVARPQQGRLGFYEVTLLGRLFMFIGRVAALAPDARDRAEARGVVEAALGARQSILRSTTPDGWKKEVALFARRHLGLSRLDEEWLEAVSMALLGKWADSLSDPAPDDVGLLNQLRQEARAVHRQLMPLWERKSGPGRVWMLDYLMPSGDDLHDSVSTGYRVEDEILPWEPERKDALAVFNQLKSDEQHVARAYALGAGTWAEAAHEARLPEPTGRRVMRKLHRLGARQIERTAAAVTR